jgi:hypothetical protein
MLINCTKSAKEIYFDYWSYKGYHYGECHYNQSIKNIYINIPKNASTNTKQAILNANFLQDNIIKNTIFPNYESAVVILRDPIERWISGISTYLAVYFDTSDLLLNVENNKRFFDLLFERISFDDHTEQQVFFLQPFDLSNAYFFYADSDLSQLEYRLTQFYLGEGVKISFDSTARNYRKNDPICKFFKEFLFDSKNRKYLEQIKNHFESDYQLINAVKFYGR